MLQLEKAIKRIIERYLVNRTPLITALAAGDTTAYIQSTRRYRPGDSIVIFNKPADEQQSSGEPNQIRCLLDRNTVELMTPIQTSFPVAESYVEKMIGYDEAGSETFIEAVYTGDPDAIPRYPAITVNGVSDRSEWFTLESTSTEFTIEITVYVLAADFEAQRSLMLAYTKAIKDSLFRSFYPLVQPYYETTLTEDVEVGDTLIKVANPNQIGPIAYWIWLESYDFLRSNGVREYLGNGVYRLFYPIDRPFFAGDKVIRPGRHIYSSIPASVQYGVVAKKTMLKAARITYTCKEEVWRFNPFIDPLTF